MSPAEVEFVGVARALARAEAEHADLWERAQHEGTDAKRAALRSLADLTRERPFMLRALLAAYRNLPPSVEQPEYPTRGFGIGPFGPGGGVLVPPRVPR